ncbi:OmpA family protein [Palleronia sp. KMU-117]|uniref:OmpA family protein n=1 Tax=Palleronia sp. KMU-117 TaxID=3434108 RepID=UPI003D734738
MAGAAGAQESDATQPPECVAEGGVDCPEVLLEPATGEAAAGTDADASVEADGAADVAGDADVAAEPAVVPELPTEEPMAEDPATEDPVTDEAVTDEAVADEPASDEAATEDTVNATDPLPAEDTGAESAPAEGVEEAPAEASPEVPGAATSESSAGAVDDAVEQESVGSPVEDTADGAEEGGTVPTPSAEPDTAAAEDQPLPEAPVSADADQPAMDQGAAEDPVTQLPVTAAPAEQAAEVDEAVRAEVAEDPEVQAAVTVLEGALSGDPEAAQPTDTNLSPTQTVTREIVETRSAAEEFSGAVLSSPAGNAGSSAQAQAEARAQADERRDRLEAAGLGALAGLAVGALLFDRQEVVATTPERVVVVDRDTNVHQVWRDDDAVLRRPGTRQETTTYADGSTRTVLSYPDGVRIETLRDATGRVLRRERIEAGGRVTLLDDTRRFAPVEVSRLPPAPTVPVVRLRPGTDPVFGAELVRAATVPLDRTFSLAQIRNIVEVRRLAPVLSSDPVLFDTGSAALAPQQAATLSGIAAVMLELLRASPREVFLIEGHTDATGSAAFNLALSDRRAETVAQALVDYFGVPPENLVFQGYGEALLDIPTQAAEPRNRRVEIRRISTLLHPWEA